MFDSMLIGDAAYPHANPTPARVPRAAVSLKASSSPAPVSNVRVPAAVAGAGSTVLGGVAAFMALLPPSRCLIEALFGGT